ncbi:MAG: repeat-like domain, partial [Actinomycetota bacterium]|nr:repeat-like domain [Actinomycetota bacterium]
MRKPWFGAGVALLVVSVAAPLGASPAAPRFHAPVVMPGSDGGSEPSVAISKSGVRYVTWQSPGQFASSLDGVHFTALATPDPDANGDTSDAVDAAGAVYDAQICGSATSLHTCIYRSTDAGHHWTLQSNLADNHPGASDRPWIDVFPKSTAGSWNTDNTTVYLEYHTFSPEDLAYVTVSHDGGRTFSTPAFITSDPNALDSSFCNTVPSGIVADQKRPGTLYALWLSGNDSQANASSGCNYSQIGPFNKAWVSTSVDDGTTWTSHLAWHGAFDATTKVGDNANKIFGTIGVDLAGQIHVVVPARHLDDPTTFAATGTESPQPTNLLLASSPDRGAHWTQPVT